MSDIILKFFDWDKVPMKLIFLVFIVSAILTLTPEQYLLRLKIAKFNEEYGQYSGILLLVSTAFLIVSLVSHYIKKVESWRFKNTTIKQIQSEMLELTYPEMILIVHFKGSGSKTVNLSALHPTVVSLENKQIIYKASDTGLVALRGVYYPYTLSNTVLPYIDNFVIKPLEILSKEEPNRFERLIEDLEEYKKAP